MAISSDKTYTSNIGWVGRIYSSDSSVSFDVKYDISFLKYCENNTAELTITPTGYAYGGDQSAWWFYYTTSSSTSLNDNWDWVGYQRDGSYHWEKGYYYLDNSSSHFSGDYGTASLVANGSNGYSYKLIISGLNPQGGTYTGYVWFSAAGGKKQSKFTITYDARQSYTVTYYPYDGSTSSITSTSAYYGDNITLRTTAPTKSNSVVNYTTTWSDAKHSTTTSSSAKTTTYTFNNYWKYNNTNYKAGSSFKVTANCSLYGQYTTNASTYSSITVPTPASVTGWEFTGWTDSSGNKLTTTTITPTSNVTYTANWKQTNSIISGVTYKGSSITSSTQIKKSDSTRTLVVNATRYDSSFKHKVRLRISSSVAYTTSYNTSTSISISITDTILSTLFNGFESNVISKPLYIDLYTYDASGNSIGTVNTYSISPLLVMESDSSTIPSFNDISEEKVITVVVANTFNNIPIKGKSYLTTTFKASTKYNAVVSKLIINNVEYNYVYNSNEQTYIVNSNAIDTTGVQIFYFKIKDSRGFVSENQSYTLSDISEYNSPSINSSYNVTSNANELTFNIQATNFYIEGNALDNVKFWLHNDTNGQDLIGSKSEFVSLLDYKASTWDITQTTNAAIVVNYNDKVSDATSQTYTYTLSLYDGYTYTESNLISSTLTTGKVVISRKANGDGVAFFKNATVGDNTVDIGGKLSVDGTSTLNGNVGVTGTVTASSNINSSGTLSGKSANITDTLTTKTLSVTGNSTVGGTLGVTGKTTLSGTLGVTGNTTVGGTLTPNSLSVTNNTTVGGTLGVTGTTTLSGVLNVTGNINDTGYITSNDVNGFRLYKIKDSTNGYKTDMFLCTNSSDNAYGRGLWDSSVTPSGTLNSWWVYLTSLNTVSIGNGSLKVRIRDPLWTGTSAGSLSNTMSWTVDRSTAGILRCYGNATISSVNITSTIGNVYYGDLGWYKWPAIDGVTINSVLSWNSELSTDGSVDVFKGTCGIANSSGTSYIRACRGNSRTGVKVIVYVEATLAVSETF